MVQNLWLFASLNWKVRMHRSGGLSLSWCRRLACTWLSAGEPPAPRRASLDVAFEEVLGQLVAAELAAGHRVLAGQVGLHARLLDRPLALLRQRVGTQVEVLQLLEVRAGGQGLAPLV